MTSNSRTRLLGPRMQRIEYFLLPKGDDGHVLKLNSPNNMTTLLKSVREIFSSQSLIHLDASMALRTSKPLLEALGVYVPDILKNVTASRRDTPEERGKKTLLITTKYNKKINRLKLRLEHENSTLDITIDNNKLSATGTEKFASIKPLELEEIAILSLEAIANSINKLHYKKNERKKVYKTDFARENPESIKERVTKKLRNLFRKNVQEMANLDFYKDVPAKSFLVFSRMITELNTAEIQKNYHLSRALHLVEGYFNGELRTNESLSELLGIHKKIKQDTDSNSEKEKISYLIDYFTSEAFPPIQKATKALEEIVNLPYPINILAARALDTKRQISNSIQSNFENWSLVENNDLYRKRTFIATGNYGACKTITVSRQYEATSITILDEQPNQTLNVGFKDGYHTVQITKNDLQLKVSYNKNNGDIDRIEVKNGPFDSNRLVHFYKTDGWEEDDLKDGFTTNKKETDNSIEVASSDNKFTARFPKKFTWESFAMLLQQAIDNPSAPTDILITPTSDSLDKHPLGKFFFIAEE